jgi:hypothetical protein
MSDLTRSLKKFNLVEVPAIDLDGKILAGHQRIKALQLLGRGGELIDVRVPNRKLTEKESKEYLIASNKLGGDWDRAFRDLPASERAKLQPFLKKTLEAPYNPYAVHRVVASMELSDDLDDLMVRAGEQMIASRPSGTEDPLITGMRAQTFDVVVRQLGRTNPAAAARIACKDAEAFSRNGISIVIPRAQLAAIARQKIPCDIGGVLDRSKCDGGFACCYRGFTCGDSVRHACTAAELSELVKMELAQDPKKPWPSGGGFGYELLVAVAMNQNSESARQFLERVKKVPVCDASDSKKP